MNHLFDGSISRICHFSDEGCEGMPFLRMDSRDSRILNTALLTQVIQLTFRKFRTGLDSIMRFCNAFGPSQLDQLQPRSTLIRAALPQVVHSAGDRWDAINRGQPTARTPKKPLDKSDCWRMMKLRQDTRMSVSTPADWNRTRPTGSTQFQIPEARLTSGTLFARSSFSELCVLSYFRCFFVRIEVRNEAHGK